MSVLQNRSVPSSRGLFTRGSDRCGEYQALLGDSEMIIVGEWELVSVEIYLDYGAEYSIILRWSVRKNRANG